MQQEMGRRQGAAKAEISYPDVSFVCGAGLKQKMIGKASGDPRHQMKEAMDSINGLTASRQSAHWPKQPFSPHPWVQQSGHTVCTASALDHNWTIIDDELMKLTTWCSFNRLQVNWDKTFLMTIGDKRTCNRLVSVATHVIGSVNIMSVQSFKLLGVIIDATLSFVENVEQTSKKVRAALFSIKNKFFLSADMRLQFFKTFVLPHFDYCISLVIYYSPELRLKLIYLYNMCLRRLKIVHLAFDQHIRNIYPLVFNASLSCLGLFSYGCRVFYRLSLFIHKTLHNESQSALRECFTKVTQRYSLRRTQCFQTKID